MSRVSQYRIPFVVIRDLCRNSNVEFVDVNIDFGDVEGLRDGVLYLGGTANIGQTLYRIISLYIDNANMIVGKSLFDDDASRNEFLVFMATLIRSVMFSNSNIEGARPVDVHAKRLYQEPLIWIIMKDLICPLTDKKLNNILLWCGTSPSIDIAHFYDIGDVSHENAPDEPFIYVNHDVDNRAIRLASLLIEAIKAHDLSPVEVLGDILSTRERMLFIGAISLVLDKDSVDDFLSFLSRMLNVDLDDSLPGETKKIAQVDLGSLQMKEQNSSWWYLGLYEKMLGPSRGSDWTTYENLEGRIKNFWDKVEEIKGNSGSGEGVPFNMLLRLKADESVDLSKMDSNRTLQQLLSSQRIW
jgi:hypothetical protein